MASAYLLVQACTAHVSAALLGLYVVFTASMRNPFLLEN